QGWMRWVSVAAALTALEGGGRSSQRSEAPPALPAISIAGGAAVTEGGDAVFTLRAVPAPANDLPITVTVSETGSFAAAGEVGARTVTVGASGTADFAVATDDDGTDETDGSVTATLNAGDGYALGQPSAQTVDILDDDEPAVACAATSASLVATVRGYYELNRNRADRGYGENWLRVLIAFGAETHATLAPYTAAEARMGERRWSGWRPVREELERLEACKDTIVDGAAAVVRTLSISDAAGNEGETLKFTITLSPPLPPGSAERVRVLVETRESSPVSARESSDYRHNSWWLTFSPGQTEQSYWIHAFDDAHDDGGETFEMALSRPVGASIADAVGVGTITNADPLPAAYLARFGRTVAEQALAGIAGRLQAQRAPGMRGSVAGLALGASAGSGRASGPAGSDQPATGSAGAADDATALAMADMASSLSTRASAPTRLGGASGPSDPFGGRFGASPLQSRAMTVREVLLGSSFSLTGQADGSGGSLAFWGRTAQGGFNGAEGGNGTDISLDGTVTTGMLGADYARGNWLVGLALTRSSSTGSYAAIGWVDPCSEAASEASCVGAAPVGDGKVAATLPAAVPYAALRVSERLNLWGAAGYGAGEVTLKTMGESHSAGTSWAMAATGMRGEAIRTRHTITIQSRPTDEISVLAASLKARDFAASSSDVTRLRLGLEGSWRIALENGGALTPKLALGARHDGGDAETGFGIELGGGLAWSAPGLGLALDLEGRALITHEDGAMRDRGFSASLAYDRTPDSTLGLSLALRQELGGASSGGLSALLADGPLSIGNSGHGGGAVADQVAGRWAMEAGFGLPFLGSRFTGTPHLGYGGSGGSRDFSLGWRLTPEADPDAPDLSLGVLATRRESGQAPADHGVGIEFRAAW
ncbi:MAG: autotransporter outer membrane beta-barrel domain-containing protein, partial [Gammaproteobacteria bacterium]|nr:autotransporter outer membrane beta-barrel domain-containing protein [Gammaproteobacteria bacterium]